MNRRKFLLGVSASAVAAALPTAGYQTEIFREAEEAGLISVPCPAFLTTMTDPDIIRIMFSPLVVRIPWDASKIIQLPFADINIELS